MAARPRLPRAGGWGWWLPVAGRLGQRAAGAGGDGRSEAGAADGEALIDDGPQHAQAVAEGVEVAHPIDAGVLEAGNLGYSQPGAGDADGDQGFHFKAVAPSQAVPGGLR